VQSEKFKVSLKVRQRNLKTYFPLSTLYFALPWVIR
jgi:hypothetical protein